MSHSLDEWIVTTATNAWDDAISGTGDFDTAMHQLQRVMRDGSCEQKGQLVEALIPALDHESGDIRLRASCVISEEKYTAGLLPPKYLAVSYIDNEGNEQVLNWRNKKDHPGESIADGLNIQITRRPQEPLR